MRSCTGRDVRGCHIPGSLSALHVLFYHLLLITWTLPSTGVCDLTARLISSHSPVAPTIHEIKIHGIGLGRTALLRCEATAVPAPTFEWYKGEKR